MLTHPTAHRSPAPSAALLAFLGGLWLLASTAAHAGEAPLGADICLSDTICKAHYDSAREVSQANLFEAALVEYQKAYARRPAPWLLINIGRMLQRLGRHAQALESYEKFLRQPEQPTDLRQKVEGYRAEIVALLAEQEAQKRTANGKAESEPPKPIYKKWWFWLAIGAGAAVVATGVGVGIALRPPGEPTAPDGIMVVDLKF